MAEQQKKGEKPESDPTERIILGGFEMEAAKVAAALVDACFGQTANDPLKSNEKDRRAKLVKKAEELLSPQEGGKVHVYAEIGTVRHTDKRKAIEAHVGEHTLGLYRAPSKTAFKGAVLKKPPKEIAPDVETLD